jgi:hypothetical protein
MRPKLDLVLNPFPGRRTHFARPTKLPHGAASKFQPFPQQKTETRKGKAYWIPTPVGTKLTDKKQQIRGLFGEKSKTAGIPGNSLFAWLISHHSLRTNQQPASSTFLSEQTCTSHQPPAKRTGPNRP